MDITNTTTPIDLTCRLSRQEVTAKIALIAQHHILALSKTIDSSGAFADIIQFPVETLAYSVNGYDRFLNDLQGEASQTLMGFILHFKAALLYELGAAVLDQLENELIAIKPFELEKEGVQKGQTVWTIAYPSMAHLPPSARYDIICIFLFLSHAKWHLIRETAGVGYIQPQQEN